MLKSVLFISAVIAAGAATAQQLRVEDIPNRMSYEVGECVNFYIIGAHCIENTIGSIPEGSTASIQSAMKLYYLLSTQAGLSDDAKQARLRLITASLREMIAQSCVNISVLIEKYAATCKPLIERPQDRFNDLMVSAKP
jgi:hypothetical protein